MVGTAADIGARPPPPLRGPLLARRSLEPSRGVSRQRVDNRFARRLEAGSLEPHRRARDRATRVDYEVGFDNGALPARVGRHLYADASWIGATRNGETRPGGSFPPMRTAHHARNITAP